jgi:hypothetical protein
MHAQTDARVLSWPDYIPVGRKFDFEDTDTLINRCKQIANGTIWCGLYHVASDGVRYWGWVNAYYLMFDNRVTMTTHAKLSHIQALLYNSPK